MPKVIKKKIARPTRTDEGIRDIIHHIKGFVSGRQRIFLPVFIVIVVSALTVTGFIAYMSNMTSRAESLEYEAYKIYYGLYQKQQLQKEEQYRKALDKFIEAYETKKSPFSLFYIASCNYNIGKYDDALKMLTELNQRFPDDERFVPLSYYKMAVISIKKGDNDKALKFLDIIYNYRAASFKDLALIESARILNAMGKREESLKKYEELTKNFPASPFAAEARMKLGEKKS